MKCDWTGSICIKNQSDNKHIMNIDRSVNVTYINRNVGILPHHYMSLEHRRPGL
jgi:hypothetical protein